MDNKGTIEIDEYIPYPPARVWKALTNSDLLAKWLMPNDFVLEVGRPFTFKTRPLPTVNFDGTAYCEVLDYVPEKRLHLSWKGGGENTLDSTVTWRLEPEGQGTHLYFQHAGFNLDHPLEEMAHRMMGGGWTFAPKSIAAALAAEDELVVSR